MNRTGLVLRDAPTPTLPRKRRREWEGARADEVIR